MTYVSSKMTPEQLDEIYNKAKSNEDFAAYCDKIIYEALFDNREEDFNEYDAHHAAYGDEWTDEDEAALEEWEIQRRERLAIKNEY